MDIDFKTVEKARTTYHEKLVHHWTILCIIGVIIALLSIPLASFATFFIAFFVFTFGAVIIAFTTKKEAEAYRSAYKSYFIERNLASIFTGLKYQHNVGLNRDLLRASGMIYTGDVYASNDLAQANYKGVNFVQADAHIQTEHTDSDGNTTYVTIFRGRFMMFEFPKKFSFKLELIGKKFGSSARVPGKNQTTGRKMDKLKTESGEFNNTFKIYAEDGFEAFYLLDPAFMEKMMKISDTYKNKVLFGFLNNTLLIGLNNGKDSFEPPRSSKPIDEKAETEKVSAEIRVITDFVDMLSLDRKLFVNN
ncbi:DUF3137 domain-containing protein [Candidatus Saccharibacteria bacterium]|nr:DUF3137 domain-containing protein [Candidatus Saccharibacteria bacterium]